jgi:hypothetical protein
LPGSDRGEQINDPGGIILCPVFQAKTPVRINGGQIIEKYQTLGMFGFIIPDLIDPKQGEIAFALLGRPYLSGDHVPGAQAKTPDLRRGNIDVVRTGHIAVHGRTKKPEPIRKYLQDSLAGNASVLRRASLEYSKNKLLLTHIARILNGKFLG